MTTNNAPKVNDRDFIAQINAEHRAAEHALKQGLAHALEAGRLLAKQKAQVGHGGWGAWLAEHFEGSQQTAATYIRLHEHRDQLPENESALSIRQADNTPSAGEGEHVEPPPPRHIDKRKTWLPHLALSEAAGTVTGFAGEGLDVLLSECWHELNPDDVKLLEKELGEAASAIRRIRKQLRALPERGKA